MTENEIVIKVKESLSGVNDGGIEFDRMVEKHKKIDSLVHEFIKEECKKAIDRGEAFSFSDNYGKVIEIDKNGKIIFNREIILS